MTKIGKLWTGAVAYVSLLVGAGLSVAGNLADTYRTRGADVDSLDKVMAAGWPILVLLAIEMFVSPRWSPARMFQVWRWIGCLAVGGMAMVVSWTHLHDLMASRGQLYVVTVLGPLAIDGMAIMATGLILSTRVRGQAVTDTPRPLVTDMDIAEARVRLQARGVLSADSGMDPSVTNRIIDLPDTTLSVDMSALSSAVPDMSIPRAADRGLMEWVSGQERAHADIAEGLAAEASQFLSAVTEPLPQRTRTPAGASYPAEFADMAAAWDPGQLARADMVKLSAAYFGVSTRTASRWLAAVPEKS